MKKSAIVLFSLLLGGCYGTGAGSMLDECDAPNLAGERCVTLHLKGEDAIANDQVTQVVLFVHYGAAGVEHNVKVLSPDGPPANWPIAVGIHYPIGLDTSSEIYIEALNEGNLIAYGTAYADPMPGMHDNDSVTLNRPQVSGCFDGVFDSLHETGVDCGEDCPPCPNGQTCFVNSNCTSENCVFNSAMGESTCQ